MNVIATVTQSQLMDFLLNVELPPEPKKLKSEQQALVIRSKVLLKELAHISLEIAQMVVSGQEDFAASLPNWFMVEIVRDLPLFNEAARNFYDATWEVDSHPIFSSLSQSLSQWHEKCQRCVWCFAMRPRMIRGICHQRTSPDVKIRGRGGTILQPGIRLLQNAEDFPKTGPILIITDTECNRLTIRHKHAFLIPDGKHLPFVPRGPVFRLS